MIRALFCVLAAVLLVAACAGDPYKYADEPDDYGVITTGVCSISSDAAIATANLLEQAGEDEAALAIVDAHAAYGPVCIAVAQATAAYWQAVALGSGVEAAAEQLEEALEAAKEPDANLKTAMKEAGR